MSLPKFMVLKSDVNGKYLCYGKGKSPTLSSLLSFSHEMKHPSLDSDFLESLKKKNGESVTTSEKKAMPTTNFHLLKFEVEKAKTAPGYVHIRTSYNNKYLVRESEESHNITAEAHETEEDQSKWFCTLFKPIFHGESKGDEEEEGGCLFGNKHGIGMVPQKIHLIHAMSQNYVYMDTETESINLTCSSTLLTRLTVSDVEPTAILPVYLAFMGHDGKYVGTPNGGDLWFSYSDIGTAGVAMATWNTPSVPSQVILEPENYTICYWKVNQNNDMGLTGGGYTWLSPIKVNNYVVLYANDNNKFVSRKYDNGVTAKSTTIIDDAELKVVEPVLSRTILSITYDLKNARVYGTSDVTKITDSRSNYTSHEQTGSLTREFTMTRTMTWNQSVTVNVGIDTSMSFGIPEVGLDGKVDVNFSISETCSWGEEKTQTETVSHTYNFDIPPMTNQTKTVVASKSYCDVPFSCVVKDVLTNGNTRTYTKTDGLFTGANEYNIVEETHDKPLSQA